MKTSFTTRRIYTHSGGMRTTFGDFMCLHCHNFVSAEAALSGVQNRNHCPYCLSSRHLDLYQAGDRLSACQARMKAVALTLKRSAKKYACPGQGELMLVHVCEECGKISINRLATDDDNETILGVFHASAGLDPGMRHILVDGGITPLGGLDVNLVTRRLFGQN
jgi:hypothetical protein